MTGYRSPARARGERVGALAKKVRAIKERRGLTYSRIGRECGISPFESPGEKISGLCNSYVIRADLEPLVVAWVETYEHLPET